ncbi:MAG: AAA family ATPase [Myxococcales bacterium]|nr:AAA family ATPase [Myxococcales bacterium]
MSAALTVVVGGGGVGKTTTSAALGLAFARQGRRTLVVTVDPARRLADALGVQIGIEACPIQVDGTDLWARMPDAQRSVDLFVTWLFDDPAARARVFENGMYRELSNALSGVHELISVAFIDHELNSGRYDEVVLDTAPSRHALEFLDYPGRLGRMLEARTLEWMVGLAKLAGSALDDRPDDRGLLAWGKKRVGHLVSNLVGVVAIRDIAALFAEFMPVREKWLDLTRRVEERIRMPSTRYVIVTGPSGSSLDDAAYLVGELRERSLGASAVLLNRAVSEAPAWVSELEARISSEPELSSALGAYRDEYAAREGQTARALVELGRMLDKKTPLSALPTLRTSDPRVILVALAGELAGAGWVRG